MKTPDYPAVILSKGDISPIKYVRGDVISYFDRTKDYEPILASIAQKLDVDLVAIAYFNLATDDEIFGLWGYSWLQAHIFLFNRNGELVVKARNATSSKMIGGSSLENYSCHYDLKKELIEELLAKVNLDKIIEKN